MTYSAPPGGLPDPFFIHAQGRNSFGNLAISVGGSTLTSTGAWPTAETALFFPFFITKRHNYVRAAIENGTSVSGNFDLGVYELDGTRLFSTGSTAQSGVSEIQTVTIDWTLDPGTYLLALAFDNNSALIIHDPPIHYLMRPSGGKQMATAFPLPATATLVGISSSFLPVFGISEKSWI